MCIRFRAALLGAMAAACLFGARSAQAQSNRMPVAVPRTDERQETFYRPEYVTELRDVYRTVYDPVTEYYWEARWRPLQSPNWAYYPVPHVRWQARVEKVQVPHTSQRLVADTRTVRTPYLALRFAEQPSTGAATPPANINLAPGGQTGGQLASRPDNTGAAAAPRLESQPATTTTAPASSSPRLGGILRMDNDPPRRGRLAVEGTILR